MSYGPVSLLSQKVMFLCHAPAPLVMLVFSVPLPTTVLHVDSQ